MRTTIGRPSLQQVVNGVYDAALEPALWPKIIHDIAAYGNSSFALVSWRDRPRSEGPLAVRTETHLTQLIDEYFSGGYKALILNDPLARIVDCPVDVPTVNDQWESRKEFLSSERYERFHRRAEIADRACVLVLRGEGEVNATLTLARTAREPLFDRASLVPMKELSPHLRRAFQIAHRFRNDDEHRESLLSILEQIEDGVFFLDSARRVVYANAAAETLINRGILSIRHGRIRAGSSAESVSLELLLQRSIKTGEGTEADPGGTLTLHGPDGIPRATLSASPLRTSHMNGTFGSQPVRAAVFVRERGRSASTAPEVLRARFGLTPAEARVAAALQEGYRLQEIAERHGLGKETVRSQLSSIFNKTGVRRQADLIKVLLTTPSSGGERSESPRALSGTAGN